MLEKVVSGLLEKHLGRYIEGLNADTLRIAVWKGDISLNNLALKGDALDELRLPIRVAKGFLGKLVLKIPWAHLKSEPVIVEVDQVFLTVSPRKSFQMDEAAEKEREFREKQRQLDTYELVKAQRHDEEEAKRNGGMTVSGKESKKDDGFMIRLAETIVNNLQVVVRNVHIRYEDDLVDAHNPFVLGCSIESLTFQSTDSNWRPAFLKSAEGLLFKLLKLTNLALYMNKEKPSNLHSNRSNLPTDDWVQDLQTLIKPPPAFSQHHYLLQPVNASAKLTLQASEKVDFSFPRVLLDAAFESFTMQLEDSQYKSILCLLDYFSNYDRLTRFRKFRPEKRPKQDPKAWWRYAGNCILQTVKHRSPRLTWNSLLDRRKYRIEYIPLYKRKQEVAWLPPLSEADKKRIEDLERLLSVHDIIHFRNLADAEIRVESERHAEWALKQQEKKKEERKKQGFFSKMFGSSSSSSAGATPAAAASLSSSASPADASVSVELTEQQKQELYASLGLYDRPLGAAGSQAASAADAQVFPPDYVMTRILFNLPSGTINLAELNGTQRLAEIAMESVSVATEIMGNNTNRVSLTLQSFHILDCISRKTNFPYILCRQSRISSASPLSSMASRSEDASRPLLKLAYDSSPPADGRADASLSIIGAAVDVVGNTVWLQRILSFIAVPEYVNLSLIEQSVTQRIRSIKAKAQQQLLVALENHQTLFIHLDMNAPTIIIPEDAEDPQTPFVVMDLGHFLLTSDVDKLGRATRVHAGTASESDFYEKYVLRLSNMGMMVTSLTNGDWKRSAMYSGASSSSINIVDHFDLEMALSTCITPSNTSLAITKLNASIDAIRTRLSERKMERLMRVANTCIAFGNNPMGSAVEAEAATLSASRIPAASSSSSPSSPLFSLSAANVTTSSLYFAGPFHGNDKIPSTLSTSASLRWCSVRAGKLRVYSSETLAAAGASPMAIIDLTPSVRIQPESNLSVPTTPGKPALTYCIELPQNSRAYAALMDVPAPLSASSPNPLLSASASSATSPTDGTPASQDIIRFFFGSEDLESAKKMADAMQQHALASDSNLLDKHETSIPSLQDILFSEQQQELASAAAALKSNTQVQFHGSFNLHLLSFTLEKDEVDGQHIDFEAGPLIELQAQDMSADVSVRLKDIQVTSRLGSLTILDCRAASSSHNVVLTSSSSASPITPNTPPDAASSSPLVSFTFSQIFPGSPDYDPSPNGSNMQIQVAADCLHFVIDRNVISRLIVFAFEMAAVADKVIAAQIAKSATTVYSSFSPSSTSASVVASSENRQERTNLRVKANMNTLSIRIVSAHYKSFATFTIGKLATHVSIGSLGSMTIEGSLGHLTGRAHQLGCDLHADIVKMAEEGRSLVEFNFKMAAPETPSSSSSATADLIPKYNSELTLRVRSLRFVFLNRFVSELDHWITTGPLLEAVEVGMKKAKTMASLAAERVQKEQLSLLKLDIEVLSPTIIIPQSIRSTRHFCAYLGRLTLTNSLQSVQVDQNTPMATELKLLKMDKKPSNYSNTVAADVFSIHFSGMQFYSSAHLVKSLPSYANHHQFQQVILSDIAAHLTVKRALLINNSNALAPSDPQNLLPPSAALPTSPLAPLVDIDGTVSDIRAVLSRAQFKLAMKVVNDNIFDYPTLDGSQSVPQQHLQQAQHQQNAVSLENASLTSMADLEKSMASIKRQQQQPPQEHSSSSSSALPVPIAKLLLQIRLSFQLKAFEIRLVRGAGLSPNGADDMALLSAKNLSAFFIQATDKSAIAEAYMASLVLMDQRKETTSAFRQIFNARGGGSSSHAEEKERQHEDDIEHCVSVSFEQAANGDQTVSASLASPVVVLVPEVVLGLQRFFSLDFSDSVPLHSASATAAAPALASSPSLALSPPPSAKKRAASTAPAAPMTRDLYVNSNMVLTEDLILSPHRRLFIVPSPASASPETSISIDGQGKFSVRMICSYSASASASASNEGASSPALPMPLIFVSPEMSLRFKNVTLRCSRNFQDVVKCGDNAGVFASSRQGVQQIVEEEEDAQEQNRQIEGQAAAQEEAEEEEEELISPISVASVDDEQVDEEDESLAVSGRNASQSKKKSSKRKSSAATLPAGSGSSSVQLKKRPTSPSSSAPAPMTRLSLKIDVGNPEVRIPESPSDPASRFLILEAAASLRFSMDPRTEDGTALIRNARAYISTPSSAASDNHKLSIIDPISLDVILRGRAEGMGIQTSTFCRTISCELQPVHVRVSYQDVQLIMNVLEEVSKAVAVLEQMAGGPSDATPSTPSASAVSLSKSNLMKQSRMDAVDESELSVASSGRKQKLSVTVMAPLFHGLLVDDCRGYDIPLLEFKASDLKGTLHHDDEEGLRGMVSVDVSSDYYNLRIAVWEPLLEPWNVSVEVKYTPTGNPSIPNTLSLAVSAPRVMNLNVTHAMMEIVLGTEKMWRQSLATRRSGASIRFSPYVLRNQTGVDIAFAPAILGSRDGPKKIVNSGAEVDFDFESPDAAAASSSSSPSMLARSGSGKSSSGAPSAIHFELINTPFAPLNHVPVGRVGRGSCFLRPKAGVSPAAAGMIDPLLKVEVELVEGRKIVTLRSQYKVVNKTTLSLSVSCRMPSASPPTSLDLAVLAPGESCGIPLTYSQAGFLCVSPVQTSPAGGNTNVYGWSNPSDLRLSDLSPSERTLSCPSAQPQVVSLPITLHASIECRNYALSQQQRDFSIVIKPPLLIENLLCVPVELGIYSKPHLDSFDVSGATRVFSGTLERGESHPIYTADVSRYIFAHIRPTIGDWKSPRSSHLPVIHSPSTSFSSTSNVSPSFDVLDSIGDLLTLFLDYSSGAASSKAACQVSIFAPYWAINHTGLNLNLRYDALVGGGKVLPGQRGPKPAASVSASAPPPPPLLVSAPQWTPFGTSLQASVSDSSWSSAFSIDSLGTSGVLELSSVTSTKRYDVGVSISMAPGKFRRTKVVTFTARSVLVNRMARTCLVKQYGAPDRDVIILKPSETRNFFWTDASRPLLLQIRRLPRAAMALSEGEAEKQQQQEEHEDGEQERELDWSPAFSIADVGDVAVRMNDLRNPQRPYISRSTVMQQGSTAFVLLEDEAEQPPFIIDNRSFETIHFRQEGCSSDVVVNPYSSVPYAWENPTVSKPRLLIASSGGGTTASVNLNKLKTKKSIHIPRASSSGSSREPKTKELVLRVRPRGPCRALVIYQAGSEDDDDDLASITASDFDADEDVLSLDVRVNLAGIGVSLVDEKPREMLYVSLTRLQMSYAVSNADARMEVRLASLQIDNQLPDAIFPVIFSPRLIPSAASASSSSAAIEKPFVHVSLVQSLTDTSVDLFRYFSILMQEAELTVNDKFLFLLYDAFGSLFFASQDEDSIIAVPSSPVSSSSSSSSSPKPVSIMSSPSSVAQVCELLEAPPAPPQPSESRKVYFDFLHLHPIAVDLSVVNEEASAASASHVHNPVAVLFNTLGIALKNIDHAPIRLNALILEHAFSSRQALADRLARHYIRQALSQFYKVLGSIELLGNPVGLLGSLGAGVMDFFYEPAAGLVKSPQDFGLGVAKGTLSLLKNTVHGAFNSASKVTSTISKGVASLSLDDEYMRERQLSQRERPKHIGEGLMDGAEALGKGIFKGVTGIFTKPIEGAKSEGFKGFMSGVGKGIIGVAVKPVAGVLDAASKATEGIRNTASMFDKNSSSDRHRVRPPRVMKDESVCVYNPSEAFGQDVLNSVDNGHFRGDSIAYTTPLHPQAEQNKLAVLSDKHILIVEGKQSGKQSLDWAADWSSVDSVQTPDPITLVLSIRNEKKGLFDKDLVHRKITCPSEQVLRDIKSRIVMATSSAR